MRTIWKDWLAFIALPASYEMEYSTFELWHAGVRKRKYNMEHAVSRHWAFRCRNCGCEPEFEKAMIVSRSWCNTAREILEAEQIFKAARHLSQRPFSSAFRYKNCNSCIDLNIPPVCCSRRQLRDATPCLFFFAHVCEVASFRAHHGAILCPCAHHNGTWGTCFVCCCSVRTYCRSLSNKTRLSAQHLWCQFYVPVSVLPTLARKKSFEGNFFFQRQN